ncbi:FAD-dependent thymidylate synthase [Ruminococcus albus SY3]|uniref:Flavin-dependent thymidylate synthase n=1 Tax=Ruminococcus albus SY3 TaxID=1341156 RepID=A0A011UAM3_RUMAL|nr:FAD-dependent thymidylate synthase [Ruminococcus albus]EXM37659.1 FAD-dependent thymidylate synthase [Ruminococcus albus SY3]
MKVSLVRYTTDPLNAIESAASNCYDSTPNGKIMNACYKSGHHSVLEFAQFHFHIEGVSRALSHQLVRHRTASFAQRSQRFCSEDGFDFVTPPEIADYPEAKEEFDRAMEVLVESYREIVEILTKKHTSNFIARGQDKKTAVRNARAKANEDARFVLPNACFTTIDMSMDFRNLCHFMNERLCTKAQWEIRQLAQKMRKCVIEVFPEAEKMLVPKCERFEVPFCTEVKSCGRHKILKEIVINE